MCERRKKKSKRRFDECFALKKKAGKKEGTHTKKFVRSFVRSFSL